MKIAIATLCLGLVSAKKFSCATCCPGYGDTDPSMDCQDLGDKVVCSYTNGDGRGFYRHQTCCAAGEGEVCYKKSGKKSGKKSVQRG